jgi:hypothetical protein
MNGYRVGLSGESYREKPARWQSADAALSGRTLFGEGIRPDRR